MILLTGASGFIGKNLLIKLQEVYGVDNLLVLTSSKIKGYNCIQHNSYNFDNHILNNKDLKNVEILIHAGSFTPKNFTEINNVNLSFSNIENTRKILNLDLPNLKKIIYLSTIDVYKDSELIDENSIIHPVSLYANSKYYCERMIENWSIDNDVNYQILRIGHTYGPGEEVYEKFIPQIIKKIHFDNEIVVFGNGETIRSYIYIDDVVLSIINSINLSLENQIINIVSNNPKSLNQILDILKKVSNKRLKIKYIENLQSNRNYLFNCSKMNVLLLKKESDFIENLENEYLYLTNIL